MERMKDRYSENMYIYSDVLCITNQSDKQWPHIKCDDTGLLYMHYKKKWIMFKNIYLYKYTIYIYIYIMDVQLFLGIC